MRRVVMMMTMMIQGRVRMRITTFRLLGQGQERCQHPRGIKTLGMLAHAVWVRSKVRVRIRMTACRAWVRSEVRTSVRVKISRPDDDDRMGSKARKSVGFRTTRPRVRISRPDDHRMPAGRVISERVRTRACAGWLRGKRDNVTNSVRMRMRMRMRGRVRVRMRIDEEDEDENEDEDED
eukprot:59616-Rhodomonas_salina.1